MEIILVHFEEIPYDGPLCASEPDEWKMYFADDIEDRARRIEEDFHLNDLRVIPCPDCLKHPDYSLHLLNHAEL